MSVEQSNRWFNLQFETTTTQQQQQQQQQTEIVKKKIPFELDYRSVCE